MHSSDFVLFAPTREMSDSELSEGALSPTLSFCERDPPTPPPVPDPAKPPFAHAPALLPAPAPHGPVPEILESIFTNRPIRPELWAGTRPETREALRDALKRKFDVGDQGEVLPRKGRRRTEEECKFAVKRGVKALFKAFKKAHKGFIRGNKSKDEEEFYRHYFGEAAAREHRGLEDFYLPGCKLQKESPRLFDLDKTVSFAYLQRVFGSDPFLRDFGEYLRTNFVEDCVKIRTEKLVKLSSAILEGRKCRSLKLPWTDLEVQTARTHLLGLLDR